MTKKMIVVKNETNEVMWSMILPDFCPKADLKAYVARAQAFAKHFSNHSVFLIVKSPKKNTNTAKKIS